MNSSKQYEKTSIQLFILLMTSNVIAYLFQIVISRGLSVENFGTINTLVSAMAIITAPGSALTAMATKYLAEIKQGNFEQVRQISSSVLQFTILVQCIIIIILVPLTTFMTKVMKLENAMYFEMTVLICVLMCLSFTLCGMLQGLRRYFTYGVQEIVLNSCKVFFSAVLIYMGMALTGTLLAFILAYLVQIFLYIMFMRKYLSLSSLSVKRNFRSLSRFMPYFVSALGIKITVLILSNLDLILVKIYFTDVDTGIYSAGMVVAKVGMYVTTALIVPLFPMVVEKNSMGNTTKPLLFKCMGYSMAAEIIYAVMILVLGKPVITLLFGEKYLLTASLFPYIFPYVMGLSCLLVLMNYFLAFESGNIFTVIMTITVILIIAATGLCHTSMTVFVVAMDCVLGFAILLCTVYILLRKQ